MKMYPNVEIQEQQYPLQSLLFGHRIQPSQTKYEYLIEFLQVALAEKHGVNAATEEKFSTHDMFPVKYAANGKFQYSPRLAIGLKRFIFFPKSKLDGKAEVDKEAYQEFIKYLDTCILNANAIKRKNGIAIIQNLLRGFSAVNQNRSWFDQNVLPICPEVILPEGMGVKSKRKSLSFSVGEPKVDDEFSYNRYTYMSRGGEVYYLHLLNALAEYPDYENAIEGRIRELVSSFPQFTYLCKFVQNSWLDFYQVTPKDIDKRLGIIPACFSRRNKQTLSELQNFLDSKSHPFEKMEILANGLILQLMRMMYLAASNDQESNSWVIDVNCSGQENIEAKKRAVLAFKHNEEVISTYLYKGLEEYRQLLDPKKTDEALIKDAANDSYRLFRKLGKMIGIIIPNTGKSMRFSLSEDIIKFLVLAIIPPKQMITLDEFIEQLYQHFGMVIGPEQYKEEIRGGFVENVGDFSFLEANVLAFSQKLKDCGFLRDLSDATSIVENPYEKEDPIE